MPLARIDLSKAASAQLVRIVSEAVYEAMVDIAKVPPHDKFQVITRHEVDEIVSAFSARCGLVERERRESGEWAAVWMSAAAG